MDPTGLPTDNLYKFIALSGLALAAFCTWLRWKVRQELVDTATQLAADAVRAQQLDSLDAPKSGHPPPPTGPPRKISDFPTPEGMDEARANSLRVIAHEMIKKNRGEQLARAADLGAREAIVEHSSKRVARFSKQLAWGIGVGIALAIGGFGAWYVKLQRPLDAKLQLELEVQTLELRARKRALEERADHPPQPAAATPVGSASSAPASPDPAGGSAP